MVWWDLGQWEGITHNGLFQRKLHSVRFSESGKRAFAIGCDRRVTGENAKIRYWRLSRSE